MDVKVLTTLPWGESDWQNLTSTKDSTCVYECDMNAFIANTCADISRKTGFDYDSVRSLFEKENPAFFKLMDSMFMARTCYKRSSILLSDLKKTLRVPDLTDYPRDPVEVCMLQYAALSDEEKVQFLKKIGKIEVKISIEPKDELS